MNKFCETCQHLKNGKEILDLFDKIVKPTFYHCPQENEFVVGCVLKTVDVVNWENFLEFLKKSDAI